MDLKNEKNNRKEYSFTEKMPEKEALLVIRGTASTMDWSINMDDLGQVFSYRTGGLHIESDKGREKRSREEEIEDENQNESPNKNKSEHTYEHENENEKNKIKCKQNKVTDQTEIKENSVKNTENSTNEENNKNIETDEENSNMRESQHQTDTEEKKNKSHRQEIISGL